MEEAPLDLALRPKRVRLLKEGVNGKTVSEMTTCAWELNLIDHVCGSIHIAAVRSTC